MKLNDNVVKVIKLSYEALFVDRKKKMNLFIIAFSFPEFYNKYLDHG